MEEIYRNGLAEVDMILNYADEESLNKIPNSVKQFIKENKSSYNAKINPEKDLKEQNLLYETKVILSVLYRDYLASEEERKHLIELDKKELRIQEEKKREKYNINDLFSNKNVEIKEISEESKSLMIKQTFIERILNKLKRFLKIGVNK